MTADEYSKEHQNWIEISKVETIDMFEIFPVDLEHANAQNVHDKITDFIYQRYFERCGRGEHLDIDQKEITEKFVKNFTKK